MRPRRRPSLPDFRHRPVKNLTLVPPEYVFLTCEYADIFDDLVLGCTELAESGVMQTMQYCQGAADKLSAAPHFARERFFCRK